MRWLQLALFCLTAFPLAAATPEPVARATAELMQDCRGADGKPSLLPKFQTTLELNGDGQPDYLLDVAALNCAGAASFFCGTAGCPVMLFLSGSGGLKQELVTYAQAWSIDRAASPPALVLDLHGSACGKAGAEPCRKRYAWNGQAFVQLGAPGRAAPGRAPTAPAAPAAATAP